MSGSPGSASALLVFEANGGVADDFTTFGTGRDLGPTADGFADTFDMVEPLPPNEVPTSPGGDFTYDGGTVVYTGTNATTQPIDGAVSCRRSQQHLVCLLQLLTILADGCYRLGAASDKNIRNEQPDSEAPDLRQLQLL